VQASYVGVFSVATDSPKTGCRSGVFNITTSRSVSNAQIIIRQTVATIPGQTYNVGFSFNIVPPAGTTPLCYVFGSFGQESLPSMQSVPFQRYVTQSTPIVAFTQSSVLAISFVCTANGINTYLAYLDDVIVALVDDNPNLITNGGFDNSATDVSPWVNSGTGTFGVSSTVPLSPPNAGLITVSFTTSIPASSPLINTITQPLNDLVAGQSYKGVLVYLIQATYTGTATAQGINNVQCGVQYPNLGSSSTIFSSGVSPSGGYFTYVGYFTALDSTSVYFYETSAVFQTQAAGTVNGQVFFYIDSLYLVRNTTTFD
jgi:hypothetical protein